MDTILTRKEEIALQAIINTALDGMGGKHPFDLLDDMYTWFKADDIVERTFFTMEQAKGLMSSLMKKGIVYPENDKSKNDELWCFDEDTIHFCEKIFFRTN